MWLLIGDLHLTDAAKDSYRFGVFDWIKRQQTKREVAGTFIAGDMTDAKDRHSATLVNKIVSGLIKLKPPVYIDMGNHDYRDHKNPFFKFLNHIEGIHFVTEPVAVTAGKRMGIIPHYRSQDDFDMAVDLLCSSDVSALLVHQTFDGAIAESGTRLSGLSASLIESRDPPLGVYAGDVHRPQTQGIVTYIGCPYHVRFGDNFEPRSIYVDSRDKEINLRYPAPFKWSLTVRGPENILNHKDLCEGDQVKLTIEVAREEAVGWQKIRQACLAACKELNLEVHGCKLEVKTTKQRKHTKLEGQDVTVSPVGTFDSFCKSENVSTHCKKIGKEILDGD